MRRNVWSDTEAWGRFRGSPQNLWVILGSLAPGSRRPARTRDRLKAGGLGGTECPVRHPLCSHGEESRRIVCFRVHWQKGEKLGWGRFGVVFAARPADNEDADYDYAIKYLQTDLRRSRGGKADSSGRSRSSRPLITRTSCRWSQRATGSTGSRSSSCPAPSTGA